MNVDDVNALWNTHDFSPSDRRKGVGATGHCTGYGQAGWSTKIWQEREEEGEAGANGVKGEKHFMISQVAKRKPQNMFWCCMWPSCAFMPGKVNVRHVAVRGSVMFAPFTRAPRISHQHMSHILTLEVMQDLDAWYRDAIVLVDLVQPQGSSVNLLGWATDVPHRCRHGWKARRGEKAACYTTDLEHTTCCKMFIHFGHVISRILRVLWGIAWHVDIKM